MNDNLKWLLLIPVVIVAIAMGFLVPKLLGGGGREGDQATATRQQQSQALQADIDDTQQSIDAYLGLAERNPGDVDALRGLGHKYREIGSLLSEDNRENEAYVNFKKAIDYYRKYLALKPEDLEVKIDVGLTYFYLMMPKIAERELRAIAQAAPTNQRAWHSLGWVLENGLGKTEEAKAAWETSYQINPNSPAGQESKRFLDQLSQAQTSQAPAP